MIVSKVLKNVNFWFVIFIDYIYPSIKKINYGVFTKSKVVISVYNIRGQIVATLDERMLDPEKYSVSWNPHVNLPKGHYFVSIIINDLQVHYLKVIRTWLKEKQIN